MIDALCVTCKAKGRMVKSTQVVGRTPVCSACYLELKQMPANMVTVNFSGELTPKTTSSVSDRRPGRVPEEAKPVGKVGGNYDAKAMQADRDAGLSAKEVAAKHEVTVSTVYATTKIQKPRKKSVIKAPRDGNNIPGETPIAGAKIDYRAMLNDMRERRDKMNRVIEALKEIVGE